MCFCCIDLCGQTASLGAPGLLTADEMSAFVAGHTKIRVFSDILIIFFCLLVICVCAHNHCNSLKFNDQFGLNYCKYIALISTFLHYFLLNRRFVVGLAVLYVLGFRIVPFLYRNPTNPFVTFSVAMVGILLIYMSI
jgi:hypothetical protein